jgi:hypothetical protein
LSVEAASVECKLYQLDALFPDGGPGNGKSPVDDNEGWRCLLDDADFSTYSIEGLPPGFFKKNSDLISGESILTVSFAEKLKGNGSRKNTLAIAPGALVSASRSKGSKGKNPNALESAKNNPNIFNLRRRDRELIMQEGNPTVLVIRVSGTDASPPQSAPELSADVFGGPSDIHNLVRSRENVLPMRYNKNSCSRTDKRFLVCTISSFHSTTRAAEENSSFKKLPVPTLITESSKSTSLTI